MKTAFLHITCAVCSLIFLFAGCKPKWPLVEYEGDPRDVVFGHIELPVPINVAINDPLYETYTRGMGIFENLQNSDTDDNWKNADIYVYAFYSPNRFGDGPNDINYSERMDSDDDDKMYCLVDDAEDENIGHGKRARINRDMTSFLQWSGNHVPYYNRTYQQDRYKFFAYHIDDAADLTLGPKRYRNHVSYEIKIDGTQDLMCSYATPTKKQLATLSTSDSKHILNNLDELAYSTTTGNRDIFPIFQMRHQLAFVNFFLKADSIVNPDGTKEISPEVKDVRIKNIIIRAPYHGEFIVAADDVSRLGVTFTGEEKNIYMPVRVKVDDEGNIMTDENGHRITMLHGNEGKLMAGDEYGFNPFITPEAQEIEVGGFLLPPSNSYDLRLECTQMITDGKGNQIESDYYASEYKLKFDDSSFKAGHKYEVCIKVYGLQDIDFGLGDVTWKDGGSINVGDEEDDDVK